MNDQAACGSYGTALIAAINYDEESSIQILLDAGANPNIQAFCGLSGSALAQAVECFKEIRSIEAIRMLLEAGADVNLELLVGEFKTALEMAESYGLEEVIQLLLQHRDTGDGSSA